MLFFGIGKVGTSVASRSDKHGGRGVAEISPRGGRNCGKKILGPSALPNIPLRFYTFKIG